MEELKDVRGIMSKIDIQKRELIHNKIQLIKKCILNSEIDVEIYEVINNLCQEISQDVCPWIKY